MLEAWCWKLRMSLGDWKAWAQTYVSVGGPTQGMVALASAAFYFRLEITR